MEKEEGQKKDSDGGDEGRGGELAVEFADGPFDADK